MYRIQPFTNLADTMHFIVSNLIHRGGWTLVDDMLAGVTGGGVWPLPTDPTPGTLANGDYVVLAAPDAGLSLCGDRFVITIPAVGGAALEVDMFRLDGGASVAWDVTAPGPAAGAAFFATVTLNFAGVGVPKVYLFSSSSTFVIAEVDVFGNSISSGFAFGYMSTAVLRDGNTSPVLGEGEDPYPLCWFNIDNAKTAGPPDFLTSFGQGECFDPTDTPQSLGAFVSFLAITGPNQELHDQPVQYGAGVPVHILTKTILGMDDGSGTIFLRGTFPSVYITSRDVAESVVRVDRTDSEYLIPAEFVALGPL